MKYAKILSKSLLLAVLTLTACIEETIEKVEFPQTQELTVKVNDTLTLSFEAEADWTLTSNKSWCHFGDDQLTTVGSKGSCRVPLYINDKAWGFEASEAELTISMNGETKVLAHIMRTPASYNATVTINDSIYLEEAEMLIDGAHTLKIKIDANFKFTLDDGDIEWLNLVAGEEDNTYLLSVKEEFNRDSICHVEDSIRILNQENKVIRAIHVSYSGMDKTAIEIEGVTPWGWAVSADGKTFSRHDALIGETLTYTDSLTFQLKARNNDIIFLAASVSDGLLHSGEATFIHVENNPEGKAILRVSASANADELPRSAYVLALPAAIYETVLAAMQETADYNTFIDTYSKYVLIELTQKDLTATNFSILHGTTLAEVTVKAETNTEWLEIAMGYTVPESEVYHTQLAFADSYIVNPMISPEAWDPGETDGAHIQIFGKSGKEYTVENKDFEYEPALTEDGSYFYILLRTLIEEEYIVYFVDSRMIVLKALVVEPTDL